MEKLIAAEIKKKFNNNLLNRFIFVYSYYQHFFRFGTNLQLRKKTKFI